jgi:hypothetical protein
VGPAGLSFLRYSDGGREVEGGQAYLLCPLG